MTDPPPREQPATGCVASDEPTHVDLVIDGMSCASCASRIERGLNNLDGVAASVNFATHRASVDVDPGTHDVPDLVEVVERLGYRAHQPQPAGSAHTGGHDHGSGDARGLARRAIATAVLGLPVLLLSMVPPLQFRGWQWVALALAAPVVTWGAWPFHKATLTNLAHGATTMDTLVSLGVTSATGISVWNLLAGDAGTLGMRMHLSLLSARGSSGGHLYLEVATATTVFLLTGRTLEARATGRAGSVLESLLALGSGTASVLVDGVERQVNSADLAVGARFVVRPGERIATDGIVVSGRSAIDRSLITGESVPEEVGPGDEVIGATVNSGGRLVVDATRVGSDTALAQIGRLVEAAQNGKADAQRLADRISAVFVPTVLVIALGTLVGWLVAGGSTTIAISAAIAVLVVACPCALGLATPTALMVGTGRGAQLGVLIKGPQVLEMVRRVDTVVLDKTGTVTTGQMSVLDIDVAPGTDVDRAWHMIGAVENAAEHPVARAIAAEATRQVGDLPPVDGFEASVGLGVRGTVGGIEVTVGRSSLLIDANFSDPAGLADDRDTTATVVLAGWDGQIRVRVEVADEPRVTSADAVGQLRTLGLRPVLLTGDLWPAANAVAAQVGIDDVIAEVLPAQKVEVIERLQGEGRVVAMVGDGVNDAAALVQADLGLAMGTGSDVAQEASDITIVGGDLVAVATSIRLSRRTLATIRTNLFWAFAYNVAAIPLAVAGLLNPVIAGLAMAASSVIVVTNSLRLRRFR